MSIDNLRPDVSIVMSVYNDELSVVDAVESVFFQTFSNWEIIIVNDGSIDGSGNILIELSKKDKRILVLNNEVNKGLAYSLNLAIGHSSGRYVARMDSDDISMPDRIEKQFNFMECHPFVSVLGGNAMLIDHSGRDIKCTSMPIGGRNIKALLPKLNPLIHPSVMMRREFLFEVGLYNEKLRKKQDYDMWLRGAEIFNYENLPDTLIKYRIQESKPMSTDLYGLYVRILNAIRRKDIRIGMWAFAVFFVNCLRKVGYKQRMHRN